jgi:hypothetical protein
LECVFGGVEKIFFMSRIKGIYLIRFGFRMWEILILKSDFCH